MRYKPPTTSEIVKNYGGLKPYLDSPEIIEQNDGRNYHDITLLLEASVSAAARKTKRSRTYMRKLKRIADSELMSKQKEHHGQL
jgi:hypothetical protein